VPSPTTSSDDLAQLVSGPVPFYRSRKFWAAAVSTAIIATGAATGGPAGAGLALTIATPILAWLGILGAADIVTAGRR
jgi:hypothetical protein